jgi:hypothetical protein
MSSLRFMLDEDVNHDLLAALRSVEPAIDVITIGLAGAPRKGTLDPEVLRAAETLERVLISGDQSTMKDHLTDHFNAGRHTCGVIFLRAGFPLMRYAADIYLIWFVETPAEWADRTDYIPY